MSLVEVLSTPLLTLCCENSENSLCVLIHCQMLYIQPFPGQYVSMEPTAVIDVCAFIGTPSLWKQHASLVWRVGPTYLFEEVLSPGAVGVIYNQGTAYLGNYLSLRNTGVCLIITWPWTQDRVVNLLKACRYCIIHYDSFSIYDPL